MDSSAKTVRLFHRIILEKRHNPLGRPITISDLPISDLRIREAYFHHHHPLFRIIRFILLSESN
jgi:hypothetical protein